jgi:hypothetical protein
MGISEGKEKVKIIENLFSEIITENFSNLGKDMDIQVNRPI